MSVRGRSAGRAGRGPGRDEDTTARWRAAAILLLVLHVALLLWVARENSVTFDENFHLPAGVAAITRADFSSSYAQPPLARVLWGAAAFAAGARPPAPSPVVPGAERALGSAFASANADRYVRVFFAARLVTILMSTLLAWMLWRAGCAWYGSRGGLLVLAAWTLSPEALAHGSLVGMDMPTALVFTGAMLAALAWLRSGRWHDWLAVALWVSAAFLVRFSAVQILLAVALLALVLGVARQLGPVRNVVAGVLLLPLVAVMAVDAGYLFQGVGVPLARIGWLSAPFGHLAALLPRLPSPLPVPYLQGLDYLAFLSAPGAKESYLLGQVRLDHDWRYFPVAIGVKWPLGLLALVGIRILHLFLRGARDAARDWTLMIPVVVVLGWSMVSNLDYGVRYVLPTLPFVCLALGALAEGGSRPAGAGVKAWLAAGVLCVAFEAAECSRALPYPLAFFNWAAGGLGRGDRIVNDSNVDWGQGLVALRREMARLHIRRIHLAYHGTTDPRLYGIDSVPFQGGRPGPESDWLAISSYFVVGLSARMVTPTGDSPWLSFQLGPLTGVEPVARPAGCIYLFRLR